MYLLMLLLPFLGFIFCSLFGRLVGIKGSKLLSCLFLFLNFVISVILFYNVNLFGEIYYLNIFSWFDLGLLFTNFSLQFDFLVSTMLLLVNLVSFVVHCYSTSYMGKDPHLPRFMSYLSLFTFFMIVLVTSSNLVQLFIGWEGVGLCSYLLINFWFTRIQANKSAIKAMVVNKVGDIGLILGIILIWLVFGNLDYSSLFSLSNIKSDSNFYLNIISLLILIGAVGKSAQMGLHMWLPDAMEGPTPVSALIHAATMVTAGIFIVIRVSPIFENTPFILSIIILFGSFTAFFSGSIGLVQFDLKKVIAYSTCSQLGYMLTICGFSYYNTSLFHLFNHGFFKALLFLSAGMIIHALNDEQDIRKMGGLKNILPYSLICLSIGSFSLMGLPYFTGFYSKDLIMELIYSSHYFHFSLILLILSAFFTSFYSIRIAYFVFFGKPQSDKKVMERSHESSFHQTIPLIMLLLLSLIIGYYSQFIVLDEVKPIMVTSFVKWLPLEFSFLGVILVIFFNNLSFDLFKVIKNNIFYIYFSFVNQCWCFDHIINYYISKPLLKLGYNITYKLIDNQFLEEIGPSKSFYLFKNFGKYSSFIHSGKISIYTLFFVLSIVIIINKF